MLVHGITVSAESNRFAFGKQPITIG